MSETRRFAFVADFIRGLMPVTGRVFACQVAFAQVRHLSPRRGPVFQPLLVGWIRQPRRQSATVFGALLYFATTCIEILAGQNRSSVYLSENNGVARYERNTKASTARSFAVQNLPRLALTRLMRISEPNGVKVTEFSSI